MVHRQRWLGVPVDLAASALTMALYRVRARVVRYGVPIDGRIVRRGAFAHSCAQWWVPVGRWSHSVLARPLGIACGYSDSDDGEWFQVDFLTEDASLIAGTPVEFSVSFGAAPGGEVTAADLTEVTVCARGQCPGTRVVGFERVTREELEELPDIPTEPRPAPRSAWSSATELIRATWGVPREFDPVEFWASQARVSA